MFFNSKKRQEKRETRRKEKLIQEVVRTDPTFQGRLNRNREILMDSIRLLNETRKLETFTGRYSDAKSAAFRLETMFRQIEDDCCSGIQEEIDATFIQRLPVVLDLELANADTLKTLAGKRKRWNGIVQILERCERVEGGDVEEAILEAESKVFRLLDEGVDWVKETEEVEVGISEDSVLEGLKKSVVKSAVEKGLPENEVRDIVKKTFGR